MIIANKIGWLIPAELNVETPKYWDVKPYDEPNTRRIWKIDRKCQVFTDVKAAEALVLSFLNHFNRWQYLQGNEN